MGKVEDIDMNHRSGNIDNISLECNDAALCVGMRNTQHKYETLTPEDFLERAKNADRILENCRKALHGI